eukprot:TRINITY_DN270_c0_g1_i2.p1 TRINITY_DN270_c0_g1~~TRINITY_DN270_c0_g1_i2.p1  ORF type:complete len:275 (-),score=-10.11 TRINITY_DN270_c0_g1_i2:522-1298(-)
MASEVFIKRKFTISSSKHSNLDTQNFHYKRKTPMKSKVMIGPIYIRTTKEHSKVSHKRNESDFPIRPKSRGINQLSLPKMKERSTLIVQKSRNFEPLINASSFARNTSHISISNGKEVEETLSTLECKPSYEIRRTRTQMAMRSGKRVLSATPVKSVRNFEMPQMEDRDVQNDKSFQFFLILWQANQKISIIFSNCTTIGKIRDIKKKHLHHYVDLLHFPHLQQKKRQILLVCRKKRIKKKFLRQQGTKKLKNALTRI